MSDIDLKPPNSSFRVFRVVEFYSGIGGMRYAFEASGIPHEVVAAIEINTVVNDIYCNNFGSKNHMQRNIESLTAEEIECMDPDIIIMSPPCQPFTRLGLKMDSQDPRSKSFLHLMSIFSKFKKKPSYFMLENVMGFEESAARNIMISTLENCGFTYQEFLLTPSQFGIPNSRLRYYLLAKLAPLEFGFTVTKEVKCEWPVIKEQYLWKNVCDECIEPQSSAQKEHHICLIKCFLEKQSSEYFEKFLLPDKLLAKHANVLDIVNDHSLGSCCFTKGYGHYVQGSGSVFHPSDASELSTVYEKVGETVDKDLQLKLLQSLKLRYFTPQEIANIMCFPMSFCFPEYVTVKQKYKALGNSVNVFVVSCLLQLLVTET